MSMNKIWRLALAAWLGGALAAAAAVTPQLTVAYRDVWSLAGGTNFYGAGWTNASTPFYGGSVLTNAMLQNGRTNFVVYRSAGPQSIILSASAYNQPVESDVAQYQVGEAILPPPGLSDSNAAPLGFVAVRVGDNAAAYYVSTNPAGAALYLPSLRQVIAAAGGNIQIAWQTTNGVMNTIYNISSSPTQRPARVLWTEAPYNSPPVKLQVNGQQVFALIHYNNEVTRPTRVPVTNQDETGAAVVTTSLVNGVWIDGSGLNQQIRAQGIEGMALLEYYKDGNYATSLGLLPIEIVRPEQVVINAEIGARLLPSDLYYGTKDLIPNIVAGLTDNSVLQYTKAGPKFNWVFALKRTVAAPWNVRIYWQHADFMGVQWPFEVDWYSLDWPVFPQLYVLGNAPSNTAPILVPQGLTAALPFQEPDNNAVVATSGQAVTATNSGQFLLQLSNQDDIWFQAVKAVWHTDSQYFDLTPQNWDMGREILPYVIDNKYVLRLDGSNDYVEADAGPGFVSVTNFTVEAWVYRDWASGVMDGPVVHHSASDTVASDGEWELAIGWGNDLYFLTHAGTASGVAPHPVSGQWTHLAGVYDGHNIMLYADGQLKSSVAQTRPMGSANIPLWFGRALRQSAYLGGKIDEVRLWNVARSQADIAANMSKSLTGTEPGLVAYYPINEGIGPVIYDYSRDYSDCYGTLHGNPQWVVAYHMLDLNLPTYAEFPGYIYTPAGVRYNVNLYQYATELAQHPASHIYAVATNDALEVWWANPMANSDGMPAPLFFPSLVTVYRNQWPTNAPQIVIASGKGNAGAQPAGSGPAVFAADASPIIYYQNLPDRPGFNPNEEHALVIGSTVYALRSDLNQPGGTNSSEPYVLAMYQTTDPVSGAAQPDMRVFQVLATNALYPAFTNTAVAAQRLQPPMPLSVLPGVDNTNSACVAGPGWRDRKTQWWAKAAGDNGGPTNIVMRYWYALQPGFFYPQRGTNQPLPGTYVPWLSGGLTGQPTNYTFRTVWPDNVPELKVAQTLYESPGNSGLPDIHAQLSVDILYQQSVPLTQKDSVTLVDPLTMRGTYLDQATIDAMAAAGAAQRQSPGNSYTFPSVAPSLGSRLVFDPTQPTNRRLTVSGAYNAGLSSSYLLLNLIESYEYSNVLHLADDCPAAMRTAWLNAVNALPQRPLTLAPNQPFTGIALAAGQNTGVGYVTLAFNNATNPAMVPAGQPVSLNVIKVVPQLARQTVQAIYPANVLDEQLTLRTDLDYGGDAGRYFFEWRTLPPTAQGLAPTNTPADQWMLYQQGVGSVGISLGGASLNTIVDNYYITRFRPADTNGIVGTNVWSAWSLGFAPGWIQRVLNGITPFQQRVTDLNNYGINAGISMIQQAGGPYNGPVALNASHLEEFGLIQIYQTVLERGRMLSIDAGIDYAPANDSLRLAAGRIADLYMVLGNEAYADAQDPTIVVPQDPASTASLLDRFGVTFSSLFCFDNQMETLLDEELGLLRGRDSSLMPAVTTPPFYNRLPWNYTRDLTGGEVAYALNYNIQDAGGTNLAVDAAAAKALYPQGHGDAWGHYLSALCSYYSLIAHTNFDWVPGIGAMQMGGDLTVNVDYFDERRFARAAAALARAGADIVNRTYRKFYEAGSANGFPGYLDEQTNRAWGVAEWASRAGQAAYLNWAAANSLLPTAATDPDRNYALTFTNQAAVDLGQHAWPAGTALTLEMWIQTTNATEAVLFGGAATTYAGAPQTNRFYLTTNGLVAWRASLDGVTLYSTNRVNDGAWHHLAWVYNPASYSNAAWRILYVDAEEHARTPTQNLEFNNWYWALGAYRADGTVLSGFFSGRIDEVRLWQAARSGGSLALSMNRCLGGHEAGLLNYYPFYEGSGTLARDQAGNNAGTIQGAGWIVPAPGGSNSLVPPAPATATNGASFAGILTIDRKTVPELGEIAARLGEIQMQMDNANLGQNPLGLVENVVPFDISPAEIDQGQTHFEQIYRRAVVALRNAATTFDKALGCTLALRAQFDSAAKFSDTLSETETDYHDRLIEIFGYPYSDDIGPGGAYPQGYDGPDLVNYAVLDMKNLIGTEPVGRAAQVKIENITFEAPTNRMDYEDYHLSHEPVCDTCSNYISAGMTVTVYVADTGLRVKPPDWSGRRKSQGEIQQALGQYVQIYYQLMQASADYEATLGDLERKFGNLRSMAQRTESEWDLVNEHSKDKIKTASWLQGLKTAKSIGQIATEMTAAIAEKSSENLPDIIMGAAGIASPVSLFYQKTEALVGLPITIAKWAAFTLINGAEVAAIQFEGAEARSEAQFQLTLSTNAYASGLKTAINDFESALEQQYVKQANLFAMMQTLANAAEQVNTVLTKGQRVLANRVGDRAAGGRQIQGQRYADMAFRLFRNEALQQYSAAFDLAARYVYLAAKAYDYETGMLSSESGSATGRQLLSAVIRARALGRVVNDEPQLGGAAGDPGLADILARMKADWDVLDGRFGFNNPDTETRRISLRTELLRSTLTAASEMAWQNALNTRFRVTDLNEVPEYEMYCKPCNTSTNREPGLVIPFATTILAGQNIFGEALAGGDNAFNPTFAATKIRAVGVWFYNYNNGTLTNSGGIGAMADEPFVYLVPAGLDVLRSPTDPDVIRAYNVCDQALPLPYTIEDSSIIMPNWIPINDTLPEGFDQVRHFAAFRAFPENNAQLYWCDNSVIEPSEIVSNSRLIGRSVWNSRWLLILPGRTLLADPDEGLQRFIFGAGTGAGPAHRDGNGVKDIRLFFHTYSIQGQ